MPRTLLTIAVVLCTASRLAKATAPGERLFASVPFVSCPADGQVGPVAAKPHKPKRVALTPQIASQLAYYHSAEDEAGPGVLAPRGWHCFGTYGSSGESLYVSPEHVSTRGFFGKNKWAGLTGPGIQVDLEYGGTSGRFGVAQAIVQVFPAHMQFVRDLIAEEKESGFTLPEFKKKQFPADTLTYRSKELVEFTTRANTDGIGTESWLKPSSEPIRGMMFLGGITDANADVYLVSVFVRLPRSLAGSASVILAQVEAEARTAGRS